MTLRFIWPGIWLHKDRQDQRVGDDPCTRSSSGPLWMLFDLCLILVVLEFNYMGSKASLLLLHFLLHASYCRGNLSCSCRQLMSRIFLEFAFWPFFWINHISHAIPWRLLILLWHKVVFFFYKNNLYNKIRKLTKIKKSLLIWMETLHHVENEDK